MTGHRRRAARAARTSDVTRFRGVAIAALVAALVVAVVTVLGSGHDGRSGSPGPLSRAHQIAAVGCASCHGDQPAATGCVGCHGAHPSTRAPHRAATAAGALACADCHPAHRPHGGAAFAPDGSARRVGPGGARLVEGGRFRPVAAVIVPIVPVAACARCHDANSPRDPIAACLIAGQDELGAARPTVCFDEHRPVRDAGTLALRSAAWDAAREIAAVAPFAPAARAGRSGPWWWIGIGLIAGMVGLGAVRGLDRRTRQRAPTPTPTQTPTTAVRRLPLIDAASCLGCHACVDACPYDVLEVRRYVAVVARPTDCCGLTLCEQKCPNGSLVMGLPTAHHGGHDLDDSLESRRIRGLFLAGDVSGQPLIRNAIEQGARAVRAIASRPRVGGDTLDLLIVGAGPAGLSAALEARALGLRALTLEQATVADSIRSFPRGKLIIDQDTASDGPLWLAETSKEELLARWLITVRQQRPAILEGQRVIALERGDGDFVIRSVDRHGAESSHRARHLLLAVGRRGTPRRLIAEIPPAMASHVHYSLADARSFAGRRVLVVGLGDVAMEAAVALSRQPGTEVVVSYRGADFHRGKARNIAELRRRVASATVRIVWRSDVARLTAGRAVLTTPDGPVEVGCDAVLVLIGAIPPEDLLRRIGLVREQTDRPPGSLNPGGPEPRAAAQEALP